MFKWYWAFAILFIPLIHLDNGQDSRIYKDLFFIFYGLLSILIFGWRKNIITSLFGIYFIFHAVTNISVLSSQSAPFQVASLMVGLCLIAQLAHNWDNSTSKALANAFSIAAILQAIYIIFQKIGYEPMLWVYSIRNLRGYGDVAGSLCNSMATGAYLGPISIFLLRPKWVYAFPIVLISLVFLNSSMGYLSIVAASIYLLCEKVLKWDKLCMLFLSVFSVYAFIYLFIFNNDLFYSSRRYDAWIEIINNIGFSLNGKGLGYMGDELWKHIKSIEKLKHAHNEFIQAYVSFGAIGVMMILATIFSLLKNHSKEPYFSACLVGYLASSFGSFTVFISSSSIGIIICLGALLHYFFYNNALCVNLIKPKQEISV